jgi:NTE family protein
MGADLVIAVDVAEGLEDTEDLSTGLGIVLRTNEISRFILSQLQRKEADVVISPDVSGIHWSDFGHLDECLRAGEQAARQKLDEIKSLVKRKKMRKFFRLPFGRSAIS